RAPRGSSAPARRPMPRRSRPLPPPGPGSPAAPRAGARCSGSAGTRWRGSPTRPRPPASPRGRGHGPRRRRSAASRGRWPRRAPRGGRPAPWWVPPRGPRARGDSRRARGGGAARGAPDGGSECAFRFRLRWEGEGFLRSGDDTRTRRSCRPRSAARRFRDPSASSGRGRALHGARHAVRCRRGRRRGPRRSDGADPSAAPVAPSPSAPGMTLASRVLLGLVAGLAAGVALSLADSPASLGVAALVEPVGTLWVNAIRMTVVPLVVSLLVVGVGSGADAAGIGRLGGRALILFLLLLTVTAALTVLVAVPLFQRLSIEPAVSAALRASAAGSAEVAAAGAAQVPRLSGWLVGLVPATPVRAAADGAMLPLIVFALAFGLALTRLSAEAREPV